MAHGFNISTVIKLIIKQLLQIKLPLILCIDLKLLYKCLVKLGTIKEKRLIIDIIYFRQLYKYKEIIEVKWTDSDSNPTNLMTKSKAFTAFRRLIDTNYIKL